METLRRKNLVRQVVGSEWPEMSDHWSDKIWPRFAGLRGEFYPEETVRSMVRTFKEHPEEFAPSVGDRKRQAKDEKKKIKKKKAKFDPDFIREVARLLRAAPSSPSSSSDSDESPLLNPTPAPTPATAPLEPRMPLTVALFHSIRAKEQEDDELSRAMELSMETYMAESANKPPARAVAECGVCLAMTDDIHRVSMACEHEFCTACIIGHVKAELSSQGNVVRCPGCIAERTKPAPFQHYPTGAAGLVDPGIVVKLVNNDALAKERFIRSGQIARFAAIDPNTAATMTRCPSCYSTIVGKVSANAARCTNPACGMLVCARGCGGEFHQGKTCEEATGLTKARNDSRSDAYLARTSKKCPHCGVHCQHFRGHGCHHMTCKGCQHQFCFCCLSDWKAPPQGHRCPMFCNERCSCVYCDVCARDMPCAECGGNAYCKVCSGEVPKPDYFIAAP